MTGRYKAYPEYKNSAHKWLGDIPSHWNIWGAKRIFSSVRVAAKDTDEQLAASQKYGVIPQSLMMQLNSAKVMLALKGTDSFRHVDKDNFVISLRSFEGGIEHSAYEGCVSPAYTVLKASQHIYYAFYKYLLKCEPFVAELQSSTDSLRDGKSISFEQFGAIYLPYFDYEEQQKIANFLDHETAKIDTLITKQEKLIELLKEKRQAVISHAVTKGLNPNAPMKDSGVEWLGEVPEHWVVAQLKFNTKLMQTGPFGSQLHAEDYVEGGVPLINPAHMINGEIVPDPQVSVDADTQDRLSRHKLAEGDIIFARRGELGRCAVVTDQQVGWICGTGSLKATLNERLIPEYAYLLITSNGVVAELSLESKGSTMDNLNTETLGKIRTPVPPVHEQRAILSYVDEVSGKYKHLVDLAENAIGLMKERKTALISAAVTGKIDVRHFVTEQGQPQGVQG
ncbi:restriction endonuclease subunit S [Vibrio cholerae]|nr:restriction endonuclease subunit S [Vibrio cholerae]